MKVGRIRLSGQVPPVLCMTDATTHVRYPNGTRTVSIWMHFFAAMCNNILRRISGVSTGYRWRLSRQATDRAVSASARRVMMG